MTILMQPSRITHKWPKLLGFEKCPGLSKGYDQGGVVETPRSLCIKKYCTSGFKFVTLRLSGTSLRVLVIRLTGVQHVAIAIETSRTTGSDQRVSRTRFGSCLHEKFRYVSHWEFSVPGIWSLPPASRLAVRD